MELASLFQLFSFVPVLAIGGIFWYERMRRHGAQKRTTYLLLSLVALVLTGILQALAWAFRAEVPFSWPQVFVVSSLLYFLALLSLEYAIHVKRIEESFLGNDFFRGLRHLGLWLAAAAVVAVVVCVQAAGWQAGVGAYEVQMRLLTALSSAVLIVAALVAALQLFNLQDGVIRRRSYPFYAQIAVTVAVLGTVLLTPAATNPAQARFLPIGWFTFLNLVYVLRLIEEFFFWSQYNLRSDRMKIEARQHAQNQLIRRVIAAEDEDDKSIVREIMEAALEKAKGRLVVQEYRMTGLVAYRVAGNVLRVDDASHILGYCTPLVDSRSIKNLDKQKLTDQILRTTFDLAGVTSAQADPEAGFGKRMARDALVHRQIVVTADLPDGLKGLQRLAAVVPIHDGDKPMGLLVVFKDSFDRLYPAEREVLEELAENLGTVYALQAGKEVQRERNRLKGEMNTARELQTSILPRNPSLPGYQLGTYMETATEVGGDVFDFVPTPYGTYFGIGDVAGHGLPAGMMAVISVAALHGALDASRVLGKPLPLDQVYDTVNRVLCTLNRDRIGSDKFMTQNHFLANEKGIQHVGTHLVAALWRARTQTVEELEGLTNRTGFLGLSEYIASESSLGSFVMEKDDVLVLYSDGVSEAKNGNGTLFGLEGIKQALVEHADLAPQAFIESLLGDLRRHSTAGDLKKHGGRYADDVTLVVLKKE